MSFEETNGPKLPRVAITYCTQCRWMLRAAYFGQELLSTFSTSIGEVALIPATGGIFTVKLTHKPALQQGGLSDEAVEVLLWDRKSEGGFPETKVLKQRFRDHVEPGRDLGHSDVKKHVSAADGKAESGQAEGASDQDQNAAQEAQTVEDKKQAECEDCK